MTEPLLATKLFLPVSRAKRVIRPQLVERLNQAALHTLTLVAAPAGFGKTTALAEWTAQTSQHVAWVALDEGDNDPRRFWSYVVAALQRLIPDIGASALAHLQTTQLAVQPLLTNLINEIADLPGNLALVLDDYHVIVTQAVHDSMAYLLEHLPSNTHVILASRIDPTGLPLARLRARGHLAELRAEELRFGPDETATFLNQVMGLDLQVADIAMLEQRTEGWAAALQLAALSIQGQRDAAGFIKAFGGSNRFLLDYLVEEVLNRQSEDVREFLLNTSVLERLSGRLCDAVLGHSSGSASQRMLEQLEHNNLFVMVLDDDRRWYRYHHLFAEALHHRLRQTQPDSSLELHRRASLWFEQEGLTTEAIDHALEARDFDRAANLIESVGMQVFVSSVMQHTVQTWLARLPETIMHARSRLCLIHAWLLINQGNLSEAARRVDDAEHASIDGKTVSVEPDRTNTQGEIAATRAILSIVHGEFNPERTIVWADEALARLKPDNLTFRSASQGALGIAHLGLGDVRQAERSLAEATTAAQTVGNVNMAVAATINFTNLKRAQGALHQAQQTSLRCLDWLTERQVLKWPNAGGIYANLAACAYETGDLAMALSQVNRAVELADQAANPQTTALSWLMRAQISQAQHDSAGTLSALHKVESVVREIPILRLAAFWPFISAHFHLALGQAAEAYALVSDIDEPHGIGGPLDLVWACDFGWITQARVLIALGRATGEAAMLQRALSMLERHHQIAESLGLNRLQVHIHLLRALVHDALGEHEQAHSHLGRALMLAKPERYVRTFVDEGEPARTLLAKFTSTPNQNDARADVDGLLSAFGVFNASMGNASRSVVEDAPSKTQDLAEPLSERELEVLQLIAQGLSNQEIAGKLFVAQSTVKKHINSIFGKLNARHRTQAVAYARELGLV